MSNRVPDAPVASGADHPTDRLYTEALKGNWLPLLLLTVLVGGAVLLPSQSNTDRTWTFAFFLGGIVFGSIAQVMTWRLFLRSFIAKIDGRSQRLAEESAQLSRSLLVQHANGPDALIHDELMARLEEHTDGLEKVIIIRRDGPDEFKSSVIERSNEVDYARVVMSNVGRGIRYYWICLDSPETQLAIKEATQALGALRDLAVFLPIDVDDWTRLPTPFESVFLLTTSTGGDVFMRMPSVTKADVRWFKLPSTTTRDWVGTLHSWTLFGGFD